ncbi:MAG: tetraacyldisaccharide 4'-kinase [SAR324 cluster bacterium]|nr:tetraacyldisaccharide 4'-kinase [SAR324 cluster bacterium]MBL7034250.1 tetraacyldisaccharide 4'-kinase [SAR324 cluster bacterium]
MIVSNIFLKAPLLIISLIYKALVLLRIQAYKKSWLKTYQATVPVISVGNLTVGGTGKTPVVDFLVKELQKQNTRPVILTRGYRRKGKIEGQRLRYCEDITIDPRFFGDEAFLLAQRNPEVPVYVGSSRTSTSKMAEELDQPDVLVLDDAFQHLAMHRDLNLLLIDAEQGFGQHSLLPLGVLREPENQWIRADAIIITKANLASSGDVLQMLKHDLKVTCPVIKFNFEVECLSRLDEEIEYNIVELKAKRVFLSSGIANPAGLKSMVKKYGAEIIAEIEFPDHHDYTFKDVEKILKMQEQLQPDLIITTEKDAVKLRQFPELLQKIWILKIGVHPEDAWYDFFAEHLKNLLIKRVPSSID